jgi:very-short-patch-repair endonuclease
MPMIFAVADSNSPPYQGGVRGGPTMTKLFNRISEKQTRRALRSTMTRTEILLWNKFKAKQIANLKFRRQHSIGPYIVDFYCPSKKLAIEIDGDTHDDTRKAYDQKRQCFIESFGISFLRFTNTEVEENLEGVLEKITEAAGADLP